MATFYYGGQAVLEGVMMRGRGQATVAIRRRSGEIITHSEVLPGSLYHSPYARLPFIRGWIALWEMLVLGMRMMLYSANVQARSDLGQEIPRRLILTMLTISLSLAIGVFFVFPLLVARAGGHLFSGSLAANIAEGVLRLALFLAYLSAIGRMERMRRIFQYHGAEHKTINAYEHGSPLTPAAVQRFSTIHVRCGTAFLLWVVVLSIFVFALLGRPPFLLGIVERIVLVPVIAAMSYEILRFGARFYHVLPVRIALQPGLWLQRLTTREPTDDQVEVAIRALCPVLEADGIVPLCQTSASGAGFQQSQAVP